MVASVVLLAVAALAGFTRWAIRRREAIRQCTFRLMEVGVRPTGLVSASLRLGLAVRNPGPGAVAIDRIEYDVTMGGRPLVKGEVTQHLTVAALAEGEVPVTIELDAVTVGAALLGALLSGTGRLTLV